MQTHFALAQTKLGSIVMVTDDEDSIVRAYTRQGFTVQPLERDPVHLFRDQVIFPNHSSLIFESPRIGENWRKDALQTIGRPFVSELNFHTVHADSLRHLIEAEGIGVVLIDSTNASKGFSIDSTAPLVIKFVSDSLRGSYVPHDRGYYRIDWLILGASEDTEERLRLVFDAVGFRKGRSGCCDFWRAGPASDFTFLRFETPQAPWRGETHWLSIGKNAIYFAY